MIIPTSGVALAALFLIIPIYVMWAFRINLTRQFTNTVVTMLLKLGIVAAALYAVTASGSWWASIAFALLLMLYSAAIATLKARIKFGIYFLPILAGMLSAVTLTSLCLIFINLQATGGEALKCLVPLAGLLTGGIVRVQAKAMSVYCMGLRHHNRLYYYLLGNGATHSEALHYLMKRALEQSLIPGMSQMAVTLVSAAPVVVWVNMLCGESIFTAVALQLLLFLATLSASVLAVLVSITVARHYSLDEYGRIKKV